MSNNENFVRPSWMDDTSRKPPKAFEPPFFSSENSSQQKNKQSKDSIDIPDWVNENYHQTRHEQFVNQYKVVSPSRNNQPRLSRPKTRDIHSYEYRPSPNRRNIKGWIATSLILAGMIAGTSHAIHSVPSVDKTVQSSTAPISTSSPAKHSNTDTISLESQQNVKSPVQEISREKLLLHTYSQASEGSYLKKAFETAAQAYMNNFTSKYSYLANVDNSVEFVLNSLSTEVQDSYFSPGSYFFLENLLRELNKVMVAETTGEKPDDISFLYSQKNKFVCVKVNGNERFKSPTTLFQGDPALTAAGGTMGHALCDNIFSIAKLQSITDENSNPYVKEGVSKANINRANQIASDAYWLCTGLVEQYLNGRSYSLENGILGENFSDMTPSIDKDGFER